MPTLGSGTRRVPAPAFGTWPARGGRRRGVWRRHSRRSIYEAAHKISDAVRPEKIILFGSYAYGRPTPDSDVDFLVVHRASTREGRRGVAFRSRKALTACRFPFDIIVHTPSQIRGRVSRGDCFLNEITTKGVVLYAR